jgi:hypothetical protein
LGSDGKVLIAVYSPDENLGCRIDFLMWKVPVSAAQLVGMLSRMIPGTTFALYTQRRRLEVVR